MKMMIHDRTNTLDESGRSLAHSKITSAFAKFGFRVDTVSLYLSDVNGPRGGVDQECKIVVKLRRADEVVVTAKDQSQFKAIAKVIHRAERAVVRRVEKSHAQSMSGSSRMVFASYRN